MNRQLNKTIMKDINLSYYIFQIKHHFYYSLNYCYEKQFKKIHDFRLEMLSPKIFKMHKSTIYAD